MPKGQGTGPEEEGGGEGAGKSPPRRGLSINEVEDRLLWELTKYINPSRPEKGRSDAAGKIFRAVYDLLVESGTVEPAPDIPEHEYKDWAARLLLKK